MLLDKGMDTGPVVAQREYRLSGDETADNLTNTLFARGAALLAENLLPWTRGGLEARPQDNSAATVSRKLERGDGNADWSPSAETLARQCRAYSPWPGLYTEWQGKTVKLLESDPVLGDTAKAAAPGQVVAQESGGGPYVCTGQGMLALRRLQLEGRRAVSGDEFLRGYPEIVGATLGSRETKS